MQLFNLINARKLGEREFNIFKNLCNNAMFILVTIFCFAVQLAIVQYGGKLMRTTPLKFNEQLICFGIGFFTLVWGAFIKIILPSRLFEWLAIDDREWGDKEEASWFSKGERKSFRISSKARVSNSKKALSD